MRNSKKILTVLFFASTLLGACGKGGGCPNRATTPNFNLAGGGQGDGGQYRPVCLPPNK